MMMFDVVASALRGSLAQRRENLHEQVARFRDQHGHRANEYRRIVAMYDEMIAVIDRQGQPALVPEMPENEKVSHV